MRCHDIPLRLHHGSAIVLFILGACSAPILLQPSPPTPPWPDRGNGFDQDARPTSPQPSSPLSHDGEGLGKDKDAGTVSRKSLSPPSRDGKNAGNDEPVHTHGCFLVDHSDIDPKLRGAGLCTLIEERCPKRRDLIGKYRSADAGLDDCIPVTYSISCFDVPLLEERVPLPLARDVDTTCS